MCNQLRVLPGRELQKLSADQDFNMQKQRVYVRWKLRQCGKHMRERR